MNVLRKMALGALAAGLWAGSATAATFSLFDTLAAGQGRTYVFDVAGASELEAGIGARYTWFFPLEYPSQDPGYHYILDSQFSTINAGCSSGVCSPPNYYPTPDSYISILATVTASQIIVIAENHTVSTPLSGCNGLTTFSICARQFDPAKVGVSFSYSGDLPSYTVTSNAVPEPSTWAMMIAGFGLVGSALRRRRVATV